MMTSKLVLFEDIFAGFGVFQLQTLGHLIARVAQLIIHIDENSIFSFGNSNFPWPRD